jgi:toxin CptA
MSIATSVIVQPSRLLSLSLVVMGFLLLTTATLLVNFPADGSALVFHQSLVLLCAIAAITSFLYAARYKKIFFIDISGNGVIHLRQTEQVTIPESVQFSRAPQDRGELVQLQRDSTLWSMLLLLRFQSVNGYVRVVIVLPDSLNEASFRELHTACHWIAAKNPDTDM